MVITKNNINNYVEKIYVFVEIYWNNKNVHIKEFIVKCAMAIAEM